MHSRRVKINNVKEMKVFSVQVCKEIQAGDYILLTGELGAGKTTFVQGLAKALGVVTQVTSPTFTVVGEYETDYGDIKKLVHVDLYRLSQGSIDQDVAVKDVLEDNSEGRITVIEWADRLSTIIAGRVWNIEIKHGESSEERVISMELWQNNKK